MAYISIFSTPFLLYELIVVAFTPAPLQEFRVPILSDEYIRSHVANALAEDIGSGDATTNAIINANHRSAAVITTREEIVLCGVPLVKEVFNQLDSECEIQSLKEDGHQVEEGGNILSIMATTRALLAGERTALNFIQRLSGIATLVSLYAEEVKGSKALVLDTRKTTPGWRLLEKYAVQCGGGRNHRRGLDDMIMIKDNHLASMDGPNRIARAIDLARKSSPELKIEVEADTIIQAKQAAEAGADIILLDNMSVDELREAISVIDNRSQIEASGRVNIDNINQIASTGVNYISVGAITHSAPAIDVSLKILK